MVATPATGQGASGADGSSAAGSSGYSTMTELVDHIFPFVETDVLTEGGTSSTLPSALPSFLPCPLKSRLRSLFLKDRQADSLCLCLALCRAYSQTEDSRQLLSSGRLGLAEPALHRTVHCCVRACGYR